MQQYPVERLGGTRIKILYPDKTASFHLSGSVTLGDIASTLSAIAQRNPGRPVAIYVTLTSPN